MPSTSHSHRPAARSAWLRAFPSVCAALALAACSSSKKLTVEQDCQAKFDKLHAQFEKKKYHTVKDPLTELVTSCPGSPFSEQALFEVAESYFHLKDWAGAESEYSGFFKEYPNSRRYGEIAHYHHALSLARQVEIPQRDQTKTGEAIVAMEQFISEFAESPYADSARPQIDGLRKLLVEKELQIARLYRRMDEPQAAAIYYKDALKQFGGLLNEREVNLHLAECYIEMYQFDEAESYLAKFDGIAANDPFKQEVKQAYQQLEKARAKLAREKKEEQERSKRQENM